MPERRYAASAPPPARRRCSSAGLIHLFVTDAIQTTAQQRDAGRSRRRRRRPRRLAGRRRRAPGGRACRSRRQATPLFVELKAFIYRFIINHQEVNRQDHRAHLVISGLFRAYYSNPLTLPTYVLLRFHEETGRPYLRDVPIPEMPDEVRALLPRQPAVRPADRRPPGRDERPLRPRGASRRCTIRGGPLRPGGVSMRVLIASDHAGSSSSSSSQRTLGSRGHEVVDLGPASRRRRRLPRLRPRARRPPAGRRGRARRAGVRHRHRHVDGGQPPPRRARRALSRRLHRRGRPPPQRRQRAVPRRPHHRPRRRPADPRALPRHAVRGRPPRAARPQDRSRSPKESTDEPGRAQHLLRHPREHRRRRRPRARRRPCAPSGSARTRGWS